MTESDLMEYVRKDFNDLGYETYAEVTLNGRGGKRCDMYARIEDKEHPDYGHTIVFEAKLSFNFKVIEQAYAWKRHAHLTYIVVPTAKRAVKSRKFARKVCEKMGVGVIEVNIDRGKYYVTVQSPHNDKPKYPKLFEQQKNVLSSGTSSGGYITAFNVTVMNIDDYMKDKKYSTIIDIVRNIEHHYKSENSACNSIKVNIERNIIKGYRLNKIKNRIVIEKK